MKGGPAGHGCPGKLKLYGDCESAAVSELDALARPPEAIGIPFCRVQPNHGRRRPLGLAGASAHTDTCVPVSWPAVLHAAVRLGQARRPEEREKGPAEPGSVPMPWGCVRGECPRADFVRLPPRRAPSFCFVVWRSGGDGQHPPARASGHRVRAAAALRRPLNGGAFAVAGCRRAGSPPRRVRARAPQVRRVLPLLLRAVRANTPDFGR